MKIDYETLRRCNNCRFEAKNADEPVYGDIHVLNSGEIAFFYSPEDVATEQRLFPSHNGHRYIEYAGREKFEFFFSLKFSDFKIIPRDPETYQDWQVGDKIIRNADVYTVIFRCGEVVLYKYEVEGVTRCCSCPYICEELFRDGYRLVLTDIEKQIIEGREYKPQDGDICFASTSPQGQRFIIIYNDNSYSLFNFYGSGWKLRKGVSWEYSHIRPATDDERQKLFDAMAKEGKRWNAERKLVEDIKPEDDEAADVQKMISDALKGYIPKGNIEGFPVEVIAKMLERQYEQTGKVDVKVFEKFRSSSKEDGGFRWECTPEGFDFWKEVLTLEDFSAFFRLYPREDKRQFRKFDPVLVRDVDGSYWIPAVFKQMCPLSPRPFQTIDGTGWKQCVPLNEETVGCLGTTQKIPNQCGKE